MMTNSSGLVALCVMFCLALDTPSPRGGQEDRAFHIDVVNYPRPLSEAVRQIEERFGRVVTYEDGSYLAQEDIVDVTEQVRSDGRFDRSIRVMRGDSVSLVYQPTGTSLDAQVGDVLAQLLAQWNRPSHSGEFRVAQVSGG